MASSKKREKNKRVSDKIRVLMDDDKMPQRQAIATAMSMERAGRLKSGGVYVRKNRSKRRHAYSGRG